MTTHQIFVENIKCGGCINNIKAGLLKLNGVIAVEIIQEEKKVCVSGKGIEKEVLIDTLSSLGFPEKQLISL